MENKSVALILGFEKVQTSVALPFVKFTFCGVGKQIISISNQQSEIPDDDASALAKTFEHNFEDQYEVPAIQITPAFRNFLSAPGIVFKVWAPVFDAVAGMPPIIAHKIRSKKVNVKRKIEFRTEIGDY